MVQRIFLGSLAVVLTAAILVHDISGLAVTHSRLPSGPDYLSAAAYVAARHQPGETVFVALPLPTYLALGGGDDVVFIAHARSGGRTPFHTYRTTGGLLVDEWTGARAIATTAEFCAALLAAPGAWLIVDTNRLSARWAYRGAIATLIRGLTYVRYRGGGGGRVQGATPCTRQYTTVRTLGYRLGSSPLVPSSNRSF